MYKAIAVVFMLAGFSACSKTSAPNGDVAGNVAPDAAASNGNLAQADQAAPTSQQVSQPVGAQAQNYPANSGYDSYDLSVDSGSYPPDSGYDTTWNDQQPIETSVPPPPLPEYSQPEIPGDDYYWTPGYWAYGQGGYYWVPGAWVLAPWIGAVWTPPYWAYEGNNYRWHSGYWGQHVGFYGGIDYGFGYTGRGYYGAYWDHDKLNYNRAVTNLNSASIRNIYNYPVPSSHDNRVSYNGGHGGVTARPTPQEAAVVRGPRTPPVTAQVQHAREAEGNRAQFAAGGRPPAALAATRPLATTYKAPAAAPPAAAIRENRTPAGENRAGNRLIAPSQQAAPEIRKGPVPPAERQLPRQGQAAPAPVPQPERQSPFGNPATENRRRPAPQVHPAQPQAAPAPPQPSRMEARPAQEARPATPAAPPISRPAPEARPAAPPSRMEARPAPEARPAAQPSRMEARPAPQARPAAPPAPAARPAPEARPAAPPSRTERPAAPPSRMEARPAPQARPAPAAPKATRPAPHDDPANPPGRGRPEDRKE